VASRQRPSAAGLLRTRGAAQPRGCGGCSWTSLAARPWRDVAHPQAYKCRQVLGPPGRCGAAAGPECGPAARNPTNPSALAHAVAAAARSRGREGPNSSCSSATLGCTRCPWMRSADLHTCAGPAWLGAELNCCVLAPPAGHRPAGAPALPCRWVGLAVVTVLRNHMLGAYTCTARLRTGAPTYSL
jgi:hypothetical protein